VFPSFHDQTRDEELEKVDKIKSFILQSEISIENSKNFLQFRLQKDCVSKQAVSLNSVVPKLRSVDLRPFPQGIRGYISVMATLKFTYYFN
jgi:hypothetical protein